MLGNCVYSYLWSQGIPLEGTSSFSSDDLLPFVVDEDFLFISHLESLFSQGTYSHVINCIAINSCSDTSSDIKKSFIVNSFFPKILAKICSKYHIKLLHISTNWIFSWTHWPYLDEHYPDAWSGWYMMSKYLWEFESQDHLIFRTSIVWIEKESHNSLLNRFLQTDHATWFSSVFWNWLTTLTLAKILARIIQKEMDLSGVIHIAWERVSKYELLLLFKKVFATSTHIVEDSSIKEDRTLSASKIQGSIFWDLIIPLEDQIRELKQFYSL